MSCGVWGVGKKGALRHQGVKAIVKGYRLQATGSGQRAKEDEALGR